MIDDRRLQIAADALHYEITMLYSLECILASASSQVTVEYRAELEAFCLHFRNLAEFFSLKKGKADKAVAVHFVPDWDTKPATLMWEQYRDRVNQEITHLTYKRLSDADGRDWDFPEMRRHMGQIVDRFVPKLRSQHRGSRWEAPPVHRPPDAILWTNASTHTSS